MEVGGGGGGAERGIEFNLIQLSYFMNKEQ